MPGYGATEAPVSRAGRRPVACDLPLTLEGWLRRLRVAGIVVVCLVHQLASPKFSPDKISPGRVALLLVRAPAVTARACPRVMIDPATKRGRSLIPGRAPALRGRPRWRPGAAAR